MLEKEAAEDAPTVCYEPHALLGVLGLRLQGICLMFVTE